VKRTDENGSDLNSTIGLGAGLLM